jgi:thermitase
MIPHAEQAAGTRSRRRAFSLPGAIVALLVTLLATMGMSAPAGWAGGLRPGVVLLAFHPGVSAARRHAIERSVGAAAARRLGPAVKPAGGTRAIPIPLELRVPRGRVLAAVERLRGYGEIAYAEPDYPMQASAAPSDPEFSLQWGDSNVGQPIPTQEAKQKLGPPAAGVPGADDGALKAWGVSTGSPSIVIGEADTGVEYEHPDLAANIWSNPLLIGGCPLTTHGYDVLNDTCYPIDDDTIYGGHGTHVAGIMGAVGNNGIGVAGINWRTTILPVKWLNSEAKGDTEHLIKALQWLLKAKQEGVNIRVVNDSATFEETAYSQALSDEIDELGANGILFVTAAGNTGDNNDELSKRRYPCGYDRPTEICATATDNKDELPTWANYGPTTVDLAAPGVNIYSTLREGEYGYLSGGSMAAAQVSGAAALILSVAPSLTPQQLKAEILGHVDPLPTLAGKVITGGRLDVCQAMPGCRAEPPAPAPTPAPPAEQPAPPPQPPAISGLTISPRAFVAARPASRRRKGSAGRTGAAISYTDSQPALTTFTILRIAPGVKSASNRCVKPRSRHPVPRSRRCTRYVFVGAFSRRDRAGRNSSRFRGLLNGRELEPGRYRLRAVPALEGRIGRPVAATFRITRETDNDRGGTRA